MQSLSFVWSAHFSLRGGGWQIETWSGRGGFYRGFRSLFVVCFGGVPRVFSSRPKDAKDKAESGSASGFGCRAGRTPTRIGGRIGGNPLPKNRGGTPIPRFGPLCFSMRCEIEPSIRTFARPAP